MCRSNKRRFIFLFWVRLDIYISIRSGSQEDLSDTRSPPRFGSRAESGALQSAGTRDVTCRTRTEASAASAGRGGTRRLRSVN